MADIFDVFVESEFQRLTGVQKVSNQQTGIRGFFDYLFFLESFPPKKCKTI